MTNKASNLPASADHGERGEAIFLQATPFSPLLRSSELREQRVVAPKYTSLTRRYRHPRTLVKHGSALSTPPNSYLTGLIRAYAIRSDSMDMKPGTQAFRGDLSGLFLISARAYTIRIESMDMELKRQDTNEDLSGLIID